MLLLVNGWSFVVFKLFFRLKKTYFIVFALGTKSQKMTNFYIVYTILRLDGEEIHDIVDVMMKMLMLMMMMLALMMMIL